MCANQLQSSIPQPKLRVWGKPTDPERVAGGKIGSGDIVLQQNMGLHALVDWGALTD